MEKGKEIERGKTVKPKNQIQNCLQIQFWLYMPAIIFVPISRSIVIQIKLNILQEVSNTISQYISQ